MGQAHPAPPPGRATAIRLRDGRQLGMVEYAYPDAPALLYFHGHPGTGVEARLLAAAAEKARIRVIGVDRPGLGRSSHQPGRRLLDWPHDVDELADQLGPDQFTVLGFSAGAPYALACVCRIPHRLTGCTVVGGAAPVGTFLRFLSGWLP